MQVSLEDALDIKSGFRIVLTFLENRFFQNLQLEKNIRYLEDGTFEITTVGPEWNPGQVGRTARAGPQATRLFVRRYRLSLAKDKVILMLD